MYKILKEIVLEIFVMVNGKYKSIAFVSVQKILQNQQFAMSMYEKESFLKKLQKIQKHLCKLIAYTSPFPTAELREQ